MIQTQILCVILRLYSLMVHLNTVRNFVTNYSVFTHFVMVYTRIYQLLHGIWDKKETILGRTTRNCESFHAKFGNLFTPSHQILQFSLKMY